MRQREGGAGPVVLGHIDEDDSTLDSSSSGAAHEQSVFDRGKSSIGNGKEIR